MIFGNIFKKIKHKQRISNQFIVFLHAGSAYTSETPCFKSKNRILSMSVKYF